MREYRPELFLIGGGLVLRLAFAMLPIDLLFKLLEDDAWMVAAIARHWAMGNGITADGVNPTNGFHPLYPLTLGALPYLLTPYNLDAGFRANLLITALLSSLALVPFYLLARAVACRPVALGGLALIALNPFIVRLTVNAMETSLALLLLLLLWWYALVWNPQSMFGAIVIGLLAALAILARLDSAVAVALLLLALLWEELRERRRPVHCITSAALTGVLLLPYFAHNLLVFGALSPSSGRALAYMHSYRESFGFSGGLQLLAYQPAIDLTWAPGWLLAPLLLLCVFFFLTLPDRERWLLTPLALYALALTFYYAYIQMQGQPRYYIAVGVVLVLLLCALATTHDERRHWRDLERPLGLRRLLGVLIIIALNSALFAHYVQNISQAAYQAQPAMYQAARWIASNLPSDTRLGARNSGIFQYYSERLVINLDGKLNHEIIPVLERRELASYLRSKGITYIVDVPGIADYIELYSRNMSEARPHYEMSSLQKLQTYGWLLLARLRIGPGVDLDEPVPTKIIQPFESTVTEAQRFPLPNNPSDAVIIYKLQANFGSQP